MRSASRLSRLIERETFREVRSVTNTGKVTTEIVKFYWVLTDDRKENKQNM